MNTLEIDIQEVPDSFDHQSPYNDYTEKDHDFEGWFTDIRALARSYRVKIESADGYRDLFDQGLTINQAFYIKHPLDKSVLVPMGVINTSTAIQDWAGQNIAAIQDLMGIERIRGRIRSFREQDCEMIALDMSSDQHSSLYQILVTIGFDHDFHQNEPSVPDAAEAIHMLGLVANGLNIEISLS